MTRKKQEINPEIGRRLGIVVKKAVDRERANGQKDYTQAQFANEILHCTPEHLSAIIHGNRALTLDSAKIIVNYDPDITLSWLLDNEFEQEAVNQYFSRWQKAEELIKSHGYSYKPSPENKAMIKFVSPDGSEDLMEATRYANLLQTVNTVVEGLVLYEIQYSRTEIE